LVYDARLPFLLFFGGFFWGYYFAGIATVGLSGGLGRNEKGGGAGVVAAAAAVPVLSDLCCQSGILLAVALCSTE